MAWLWHHRPERLRVFGSLEDGYIVAPPPPVAPRATSVKDPSALSSPASARKTTIAVDVVGRPTGYAAGDHERRWKAAVRAACAGLSVSSSRRVALEIEYRLDPYQVGPNAPDLDNLLKATIDALDGVLGSRAGKFTRKQADDERIDRIVASKRVASLGETPGARMVITES